MLLHMDARELAETLLQISQSAGEGSPSQDDLAIAKSMETGDCTAQVHLSLRFEDLEWLLSMILSLWNIVLLGLLDQVKTSRCLEGTAAMRESNTTHRRQTCQRQCQRHPFDFKLALGCQLVNGS